MFKISSLKYLFFISLTCFISLVLIEVFLQIFLPVEINKRENYFLTLSNQWDKKNCTFEEYIQPHPSFSFTYRDSGPCVQYGTNSSGFRTKNPLSLEKDPNFFDIVVLGGSVGDMLFLHKDKEQYILDNRLNQELISPTNKPFRVHNLAIGANNFPAQINILNYYLNFADAFISIDGYNEFLTVTEIGRIDMPPLLPFYLSISHEYTDKHSFIKNLYKLKQLLQTSIIGELELAKYYFNFKRSQALSEFETLLKSFENKLSTYKVSKKTTEELFKWNFKLYLSYIKKFRAISNEFNLPYLHIVQPILGTLKPLHNNEKKLEMASFTKEYELFHHYIKNNIENNYHTYSLIDLFKNTDEHIYGDQVHFIFTKDNYSTGYNLMINKIINLFHDKWNFQRK